MAADATAYGSSSCLCAADAAAVTAVQARAAVIAVVLYRLS